MKQKVLLGRSRIRMTMTNAKSFVRKVVAMNGAGHLTPDSLPLAIPIENGLIGFCSRR